MKIVRNNKELEFNRIVAYGCSYTKGAELADAEVLPNLTLDQINKFKKELNPGQFYSKFKLNETDIDRRERELSWPSRVAQNMGVDFENRAVNGASMQQIIYRIESDLSEGKILDTDLVLVGVTSPDRWFWFTEHGFDMSCIQGYNWSWPSTELHNAFVLDVSNDYFNLYNFCMYIKYLDMLSDRLNGRLLQQYMHSSLSDRLTLTKPLNYKFFKLINQTSNLKSIIDHNYSFGKIINWDTDVNGWWHPKIEFQHTFADRICDILLGK